MADKSTAGIDFDRQVFIHSQSPSATGTGAVARMGGLIFGLAIIAAIAFVGYKLLPPAPKPAASADDAAVASIDQRLTIIEERLAKLEAEKKRVTIIRKEEPARTVSGIEPASRPVKSARPVYRVFGAPAETSSSRRSTASATDTATAQRLAALQQGVGQLRQNQAANQDAWEATTDRLADMAGQVGSQNVTILRNQDELNELVNRTDLEAIPFELLRGSNPQPIGPISLALKSTNPKKQSYTLCVYVQPTCIELKDKMVHEVVQFVASRNSTPMQVVATRIVKDEILGYLEVPRNQIAH
jgi:hypothetical protein